MPKVKDPSALIEEKLLVAEEELNKEDSPKKETFKKEEPVPEAPKKKEPHWALWYVLIAIAFFGLGILTIMLTNLLRGDGFSL
jgi:hypothetical protein